MIWQSINRPLAKQDFSNSLDTEKQSVHDVDVRRVRVKKYVFI